MHYMPFISEGFQEKIPRITAEGMRSRYESGPRFAGFNEYAGELVTEVHPILIGKILKGWCGQNSSVATGSYITHTFLPRTTDWDTSHASLPPLTAEVYRDTGSAMLYSDMLIDGFTLDIAHGKLLKMTASCIGANAAKSAKTTPTYLSGSEFTWNQCSISLGGSGQDDISQLTIKGSNALEAKGTLDGTLKPNRILRNGIRTLEISGTMILDGDTQRDAYRAGTAQQLIVTVTGQECCSGFNTMLKIDIPSMIYTEFPDNIGGPGLIEVGFKAEADYNTNSATMVKFTLINSQTAY
jgi:hypothetical protein